MIETLEKLGKSATAFLEWFWRVASELLAGFIAIAVLQRVVHHVN